MSSKDLSRIPSAISLGVFSLTNTLARRSLADLGSLRVDVNNRAVPAEDLSLISHQGKNFLGKGFLYVQFPLADGMLRDGANEVGFSLADGATAENGKVIIQEMEIRVVPK